MAKVTSQGTCQLCQGTFSKAAMSRHLAKCLQSHPAAEPASGKAKKTRLFHVVVQGKYNPQYWLHLEVPATATLQDLDAFLRHIWLECCGHLSAFTVQGTTYSTAADFEDPWGGEWDDERDMDVEVGEVLQPGLQFSYEYDFGSTTDLTLKVVSEREAEAKKKGSIRLLARNNPPLIPCGSCGKPATVVSTEEAWDESGWLCDECAKKRGIEEELCLPVVNSPRVGVCGYTG